MRNNGGKNNVTGNMKDILVNKPVNKPVDKPVESVNETVNKTVNKTVNDKPVKEINISIPDKTKDKTSYITYSITSSSQLVKKLNDAVKKKGYHSRNELVNVILELVLNSPEEK